MTLILCRFGELWLKSWPVRKRFLQQLVRNIKTQFEGAKAKAKIELTRDRIFVETGQVKKASDVLKHAFGLTSFSLVEKTGLKGLDKIVLKAAEKMPKKASFAVRASRAGKHPFTSQELAARLGALIVEKYGNRVNLTKPDFEVFVEVRDDDAYVFTERERAGGGLPVGVEGRAVAVIEKKKDVEAARLIMRRGCSMILLNIGGVDTSELYKYDPNTDEFTYKKRPSLAEMQKIADTSKAKALVLGETLENLSNTEKDVKLLVLRPLVGLS